MPAYNGSPDLGTRFAADNITVRLTLPQSHAGDVDMHEEEVQNAHDIFVHGLDAIERKIREEVHPDFEIVWST